MHISQILWILYVADGVQTNQEAEAKKKPHQWRNSYISSNDKMNCRCLLKSTADADDLRSKGLKRRVHLCLALANHASCHCMIY